MKQSLEASFFGQSTAVGVRIAKHLSGSFPRPSSGASLIPHNKDLRTSLRLLFFWLDFDLTLMN